MLLSTSTWASCSHGSPYCHEDLHWRAAKNSVVGCCLGSGRKVILAFSSVNFQKYPKTALRKPFFMNLESQDPQAARYSCREVSLWRGKAGPMIVPTFLMATEMSWRRSPELQTATRTPERDVSKRLIWRFTKIRGTLLGVLVIRTIVFWGLYWGPLFWETTI